VAPESLLIVIDDRVSHGPGIARLDAGRRLFDDLVAGDAAPPGCSDDGLAAEKITWRRDSSSAMERYAPSGAGERPVVTVHELEPGADPRDAIDRGADLVITADPSAVGYARALGDWLIAPLPPRWTYGVLFADAGDARAAMTNGGLGALRASLGGDIVPAAAQAAAPFTRDSGASCGSSSSSAGDLRRPLVPRVVYRLDDPIARAVAERLVSLATRGRESGLAPAPDAGRLQIAAGIAAAAFGRTLADRRDVAYVIAWPAHIRDACALATYVAAEAPELADALARGEAAAIPLIAAAQWAAVRRGSVGLARGPRGDPRLVLGAVAAPGSVP
jgi:hypothetical protein